MATPSSPADAVDAAKAAAEKMEKDIKSLEVQKKITETYAQQLKQVQEPVSYTHLTLPTNREV